MELCDGAPDGLFDGSDHRFGIQFLQTAALALPVTDRDLAFDLTWGVNILEAAQHR
jgi:hypothetical protein